MKKKILIADKLIQPFEKVYKLKFNVDCLWKIKNQKFLFSKLLYVNEVSKRSIES